MIRFDHVVTKADVNEALEGKIEAKRKEIIKQQLHIWRKGAGRNDVRTPFSRGKEVFSSECLLEKLKAIIATYIQVESPRTIRATAHWPSQLSFAKPIPTIGDELCNALEFQRLAVKEDQNIPDSTHDNDNIPCRQEVMPDDDDLKGKRVAVIWNDISEDNDQDMVHAWCFGVVASITRRKRRGGVVVKCAAAIEWEIGGSTTLQVLVCGAWQHTWLPELMDTRVSSRAMAIVIAIANGKMALLPSMAPHQTLTDYCMSPEEDFDQVWAQSEKIPNVEF